MLTIEEVRKDIADETVRFARSDEYGLIFCTFTGSGKTTSVLNAIDNAGFRWIYVAPNHKVIEQNVERSEFRHFNYLHLRGRERCCLRQDLKPLTSSNIGINSFCDECGFRDIACEYYRDIAEAYTEHPNLALTHAHIETFLPTFLNRMSGDHYIRDDYDIIIVDENPIKCFIHEMVITRREIGELRDFLIMTNTTPAIIRLVDIMYTLPINYELLFSIALDHLNPLNILNKFYSDVADLYIRGVIDTVPKNIIQFLFEIFKRKTKRLLKHMIYYRQGFINLNYFKANVLDLGLKIIGLDGTANERVWRSMLGRNNFTIHRVDYEYKNVYQLNGGHYYIKSWRIKNSKTPEIACRIVDKIAKDKPRNVLCVGTKYVNRKANKILKSSNIEFATYYALRSLNDFYKNCDSIVLLCEPNPPEVKVQSCVVLSGWSEDIWRRIFRDEEMLQAIGRLRQNIDIVNNITREKMEIFILPSTGVDKINNQPTLLPEARVMSRHVLELMLDKLGGVDIMYEIEHVIIDNCPTTPNYIKNNSNYRYSEINKYFKSLYINEYITKNRSRRNYELTRKGMERLRSENKVPKGIIKRSETHIEKPSYKYLRDPLEMV